MTMKNLETFMSVYSRNLVKAIQEKPDQYGYGIDGVSAVLVRMKTAIEQGTFNKDSFAFRWTCKELKIKHTYQAIKEYLVNG
jgi:hypothetical protein